MVPGPPQPKRRKEMAGPPLSGHLLKTGVLSHTPLTTPLDLFDP